MVGTAATAPRLHWSRALDWAATINSLKPMVFERSDYEVLYRNYREP